jgi:hypothetical protein
MDPVSRAQNEQPQNRRKPGNPAFGKGNKLGTKFQPGKSGNPGGRPKKLPITEIYQRIAESGAGKKDIEDAVRSVINGKRMATVLLLREMAERIEGKVVQPVEGDIEVRVTLAEAVKKARERAAKK